MSKHTFFQWTQAIFHAFHRCQHTKSCMKCIHKPFNHISLRKRQNRLHFFIVLKIRLLQFSLRKVLFLRRLKSVTSCPANRVSTNIHGEYVTKKVGCVEKGAFRRRRYQRESQETRDYMHLTSINLERKSILLFFFSLLSILREIFICAFVSLFNEINSIFSIIKLKMLACVWHYMNWSRVDFSTFVTKWMNDVFFCLTKRNAGDWKKEHFCNEWPWCNRLPNKNSEEFKRKWTFSSTKKNYEQEILKWLKLREKGIHFDCHLSLPLTISSQNAQHSTNICSCTVEIGQWFNACN